MEFLTDEKANRHLIQTKTDFKKSNDQLFKMNIVLPKLTAFEGLHDLFSFKSSKVHRTLSFVD